MESLKDCGYHFNPEIIKSIVTHPYLVVDITCRKCPLKEEIPEPMSFNEAHTRSLAFKKAVELVRIHCPQLNHRAS